MALYSKEENCAEYLYQIMVNVAYKFNSFPKEIKEENFVEFLQKNEEFKTWEKENKQSLLIDINDAFENLNTLYKQLD